MLDKEILSNLIDSNYNKIYYSIVIVLFLIVYKLYLKKYKEYKYLQNKDIKNGDRPRGKCPPFFPNGWYSLMNSDELKANEVKYVDYCGRDIVIFRGTNNKVYALEAYCSHMGANLGFGGKVKNKQCIQCPFHGWLFDGESGYCVQSEQMSKKNASNFEYHDINKQTKIDGTYLHKCFDENAKLKKYIVKELNNSILIWFDSRPEFQEKYPFEPFVLDSKLPFRGESINYVNCHIQEIPENGADMRHFDFLHTYIFSFIKFIQFEWSMKSHRASEPDLFEIMKHDSKFHNDFKSKLFERYLTEQNRKYINIISLDCHLKIFGFSYFLFNLTGFQVGPALVYLFLKSRLFEAIYAQSVTPIERFHLKVSHKM
jgi:cholesterol 7-dehydrogenase